MFPLLTYQGKANVLQFNPDEHHVICCAAVFHLQCIKQTRPVGSINIISHVTRIVIPLAALDTTKLSQTTHMPSCTDNRTEKHVDISGPILRMRRISLCRYC